MFPRFYTNKTFPRFYTWQNVSQVLHMTNRIPGFTNDKTFPRFYKWQSVSQVLQMTKTFLRFYTWHDKTFTGFYTWQNVSYGAFTLQNVHMTKRFSGFTQDETVTLLKILKFVDFTFNNFPIISNPHITIDALSRSVCPTDRIITYLKCQQPDFQSWWIYEISSSYKSVHVSRF